MVEKTLTQADEGSTIQVEPGDRILIRLKENPTTGYHWSVDPVDERLLSLVASDYNTPPGRAGAGGNRTLVFEVRAPGNGSIQLKRWREWEGESSVRERFAVKIQAKAE